MQTPELRLIETEGPRESGAGRSTPALSLGLLILVAAALATALGADRAREPVTPSDTAERALHHALRRGTDDADVRAGLADLRRTLGRRPLDTRTRVVYSSLLLGLASDTSQIDLAAFHARRAAELSPVTVPVARAAALVLAHAGDVEQASRLIRHMFEYDPGRAASLLSEVEARVLGPRLDDSIPETPKAWTAWAVQLRRDGHYPESLDWLQKTHERWPDHLRALELLASTAHAIGDWERFDALFPAELRIPDDPVAAVLLTWRARARLRQGDRDGAVADLERAERLGDGGVTRLTLAGDTYLQLEDYARARHAWNRALHLYGGSKAGAGGLLARLARLEDAHGQPASALRLWRTLLELHPDHGEARRRVEDLTGFTR